MEKELGCSRLVKNGIQQCRRDWRATGRKRPALWCGDSIMHLEAFSAWTSQQCLLRDVARGVAHAPGTRGPSYVANPAGPALWLPSRLQIET